MQRGGAQQNSVLQHMHKQGTRVGTTMNTNGEANELEGLTFCEDKATACANLLEPVFNCWIVLCTMLIKDIEIQVFPPRSWAGAKRTAECNQYLVGAAGLAKQMAPGVM